MGNEIREQILKIVKEQGISFEEEVEIIRKGFVEQKKADMYDELQNSEIAAHDKRLREEIIEDIKKYVRLHLKYAEHTIDDFIFAHPFYDWLDTKK